MAADKEYKSKRTGMIDVDDGNSHHDYYIERVCESLQQTANRSMFSCVVF